MATEPRVSLEAAPNSVAVVPTAHSLVVSPEREQRGVFRRLARLWQREESHAALGIEQLSVSTLHAELRSIDEGIAAAMETLAALEAGAHDALARRGKVALDVAWQGREVETAKIEELGKKRDHVYNALLNRFVPEVNAWSERCEATVARWQTEDRQQADRIELILREAEGLVWNLTTRETRRAAERDKLMEQFDVLSQKAGAIPLTRPNVDWTVPPMSLHDVAIRVASLQELLQRRDSEPRASAG
ncbi:MAG: hypothetical protein ACR2IK_21560 [Chloroflexota bacterium]